METMFSVRHLTLKLRSQSLNEEPHNEKADPDRDSGTESDDELAIDERKMDHQSDPTAKRSSAGRERARCDSGKENSGRPGQRRVLRYTDSIMASTLAAVAALSASDDSPARPSHVEFAVTDSALPSDSDHGPWGDQHSSEEELECINETAMMVESGAQVAPAGGNRVAALRFGPSAFGPPGDAPKSGAEPQKRRSASNPQQAPEKRKWERVQTRRSAGSAELARAVRTRPRSAVLGVRQANEASNPIDCSASSDDEVQSLVANSPKSPLPLEFRTSPPEGAHRPTRSLSPPPKLFLADEDEQDADEELDEEDGGGAGGPVGTATASPRKRHRHHLHRAQKPLPIQRPCLDFEKMQQMKNRSLSTWRHDGELSLFCW